VGGAGREHGHRPQGRVGRRLADTLLHLFQGECLLREVLFHQGVIGLGGGLDQGDSRLLDFIGHVGRDVAGLRAGPEASLFRQDVDHPLEGMLLADRQGDRHELIAWECLAQGLKGAGEAGVLPIHLVDNSDQRQFELLGKGPGQLRAHFHTGHRIDHDRHRVRHADGILDFALKVGVAGRIKNVDFVAIVLAGHQRRADGHAALALVFLVVRNGVLLFNPTQTCCRPGVEEQRLHERCLTGVLVPDKGNITQLISGVNLHRA